MTAPFIEKIQQLAGRFQDDERNLILYFPDFETTPEPDSHNRVFGPPVGLTADRWPTFPDLGALLRQANCIDEWDARDHRMEHVFTVDLRGVDLLGVPDDAQAMMLFISNASYHRACADGTPHTQVVFLSQDDLDRGLYQGPLPARSLYRWSRRFSLVPVAVPGEVFEVPQLDLLPDDVLRELFEAIAEAPARLGGCPIASDGEVTGPWQVADDADEFDIDLDPCADINANKLTAPYPAVEGEADGPQLSGEAFERRRTLVRTDNLLERDSGRHYADADPVNSLTFGRHAPPAQRSSSGSFLMQFRQRFAEINLGGSGVMYVSRQSAYIPCR